MKSTLTKITDWLGELNWQINDVVYKPQFIVAVAFVALLISVSTIMYHWGKSNGVEIGIQSVPQDIQGVFHAEPPASFECQTDERGVPVGWALAFNGKDYSYTDNSGWTSPNTKGDRDNAIHRAQQFCKYQNEREFRRNQKWVETQ